MDIVKKNLVSVISTAIVGLAVAALFWPIKGYYDELQQKANSSKGAYDSLKAILDKQRTMPVVSLDDSPAKPLEMFPTEDVIKAGRAATEKVKVESAAILEKAGKLNQHNPLVPDALPDGPPLRAITFRNTYLRAMDFISESTRAKSMPVQIMKAGLPPTEQQVSIARARKEAEIRTKLARNVQGQPINQTQVEAELAAELPKIAQELMLKAARECQVYIEANPIALHLHQGMMTAGGASAPDPSVIFNAQVSMWIQQDICWAIAAANSGSRNVTESAVKHLIKIDLPDELFRRDVSGPVEGVQPVSSDPAAQLPQNYAFSPTGRTSNGVYDVVLFSVTMNVDAARVPHVLQSLSRERFITVIGVKLTTVDSGLAQASGYMYGDQPVVQLQLQCEALLLRKWTEPLMPLRIKQGLGIVPVSPPM